MLMFFLPDFFQAANRAGRQAGGVRAKQDAQRLLEVARGCTTRFPMQLICRDALETQRPACSQITDAVEKLAWHLRVGGRQ